MSHRVLGNLTSGGIQVWLSGILHIVNNVHDEFIVNVLMCVCEYTIGSLALELQ